MLPVTHAWVNYRSNYRGCTEPNAVFSAMILPDLPAFANGRLKWDDFEGVRKNTEIAIRLEDTMIGMGLISHGATDEISHGPGNSYMEGFSFNWYYNPNRFPCVRNASRKNRERLHNLNEGRVERRVIMEYPRALEIAMDALKNADVPYIAKNYSNAIKADNYTVTKSLEKAVTAIHLTLPLLRLMAVLPIPDREECLKAISDCESHSKYSISQYVKR